MVKGCVAHDTFFKLGTSINVWAVDPNASEPYPVKFDEDVKVALPYTTAKFVVTTFAFDTDIAVSAFGAINAPYAPNMTLEVDGALPTTTCVALS